MAITTNSNNQWQVSPELSSDKVLYTSGTYVDKDILIKSAKNTTGTAALSASGTASATTTVAPGTVTISANTTSLENKTRVASTPATSTPSTTYYIAATASAAANSTGTTSNITGTATATTSTSGYATAGSTTGSGSVTGTATAKTSKKDSSVYYFPLDAATFANVATNGITYTDYSSSAPVLVSNDYLYINAGYTPARKISLAKLVPDSASGATAIKAGMLNTISAYDNDGKLVTGDIVTKTDSGNVSLNASTLSKSYAAGYYPNAHGASVVAIGFSNVGTTTNSTTGATAGYIPLVTTAGVSALNQINSLTIPTTKTLSTVSLTSGNSTNRTYLSTLNVASSSTVSKINLSGIIDEISLQGGHAYLKSNDATSGSLVYINSYDNASTPALTGNQLVVQNNKWVTTSLSATSNSGTYYGRIVYTKPGALTVTTSVTADGMSTYFDTGTSTDKNVTLTPKYTNTVGYKAATTTATNNGGTTYYKIKTTSLSAGSGSSEATGTNITLGTKTTTQPTSGSYITVTGSGTVSVNTAGQIAKDSSKTSNTDTAYYSITQSSPVVDQTLPSGVTSSGTIARGKYIKIPQGYNTSDKYYLAQADAHSSYTPSSTYFLTDTTGTISGAKIEANKYTSSTYYVIAGTAGAISGGGLTHGNITTTDTTYLTDTNTGYEVNFSNIASRAAASYSITKAGWISSAGTGLSATGNDTKTLKKYIKKGTLGSTGGNVTGTNATLVAQADDISGVSVTGSGQGTVTTAGWIATSTATASSKTQYLKRFKLLKDKKIEMENAVTDVVTIKYNNDTNSVDFIFA